MSDPTRPYDPIPGNSGGSYGQPPPAVPPQRPADARYLGHVPDDGLDPDAPRHDPRPATTGTEDPRLGLEIGRYWSGAIATTLVAALFGLAATFVIQDVLNLDLQSPPDLFGAGSDHAGWAVACATFALVAAIVLNIFVLSTPRPRTFFGWIVALATVILATLPFAGSPEPVPAILTAIVWVILGSAVWSLLTGVLARTVVERV